LNAGNHPNFLPPIMRTAFQNEEEEKQVEHPILEHDEDQESSFLESPDRELTISATTLLAIFFGLVLLCGLFFGLGYTFGRRSPASTPEQTASQSFDSQPKPSAAAQPVVAVPTPIQSEPAALNSTAPGTTAPADAAPDDTPSQPEAKTPEAAPVKQTSQPAAPVNTPVSDPAPAGTMVQIAAIANPADADVLVRALQEHGFSPSEHRYPTDSFIHIQVGPFANRADAIAMKQKLLSDGYNAILK
jgi:cell division septation protein DedD